MSILLSRLSFLFGVVVVIPACASFTTDLTYTTPNSPSGPIKKVVVVALTPVVETRTLLENELVFWLRDNGYDATASVKISKPRRRLPEESELRSLVDENGMDGVLTVRLMDVEKESRYVSSTETRATSITDTYVYNYLNAWRDVYVPGYYASSSILKVESNLYEVRKEQIIFTAQSQTLEAASLEGLISDLSQALTYNIKKSKVLTKSF